MKNNIKNIELVSVIVPVYNVDKYLKRCVDSVLRQTYTNLEIILVDDGSTDQSGEMCDDYTRSDSRVKVLHKKNGGLSDARNAGLDIANGEYIYFIDSDDFIADDAIAFLYESLLTHNADISTHGYVIHYNENDDIGLYKPKNNKQLVLAKEGALEQLMYEKNVTTSACMKLYKRQLFSKDLRFPVGKTCEDLATIYKVFSKADKIVLSTIPKYYYFERPGSLTQSGFNERGMDGFYAATDQLAYVRKNHPTLRTAAQYRLFAEAMYIIMRIPFKKGSYESHQKTLLDIIRQYKGSVLFDRKAKGSMRQRALVAYVGAKTMVRFYKAKSYVWRSLKIHKINKRTKRINNTETNTRINVLHVIGGLDRGGAETFLMNVLRTIDKDRFRFVFLCFGNDSFDYEQEAISLGATIRRIPAINIKKHPIKDITEIIKIIKEEKIDILQAHIYYDSVFSVIASSLCGVKTRIVHSHNTCGEDYPSFAKTVFFRISKVFINMLATHRVACGKEAGIALFGNKSFATINNGINLEDFSYSPTARAKIREEFDIASDDLVLLNIARFHVQKNHEFLINVYSNYVKCNAKSKLVLVGDGPLRDKIEKKVIKLGAQNHVIFTGKRSDTNNLYSSADLFILPSLYEGLPVTLIEAQANGLHCFISDAVDQEAKLTETVEFYPLSKSATDWASKISTMNLARVDTRETMLKTQYNIKTGVRTIEKLYINSLSRQR